MEGIKEAIAFITDLAVKAEKPETITKSSKASPKNGKQRNGNRKGRFA